VWPSRLSVYYPHPWGLAADFPVWQVAGAVLLLSGSTFFALRLRRRFPYFAVGWLWYLGTLLPVIGLVQVGGQAMADRYTYVPLIGIFITVSWWLPEAFRGWRFRWHALGVLGGIVLLVLSWSARLQTVNWQSSVSLYSHALRVTDNNWKAWIGLGIAYDAMGQYPQGIDAFRKSVLIMPGYYEAWYNLGIAYIALGQYPKAVDAFRESLRNRPDFSRAWNNLGVAHAAIGQFDEAIEAFREALRIQSDFVDAWSNLGIVYIMQGKRGAAFEVHRRLRQIDPSEAERVMKKIEGAK